MVNRESKLSQTVEDSVFEVFIHALHKPDLRALLEMKYVT